jgi:Fe-Mn family superoxide dismutase
MTAIMRRDFLGVVGIGLPTAAWAAPLAPAAGGKAGAPVAAWTPGKHVPAPLPFDPSKLAGLSEKLLASHHANNYVGAVKNLNKVEEQLAATNKDTPSFAIAGLKERELTFTNSMILHEQYFGNLGGNGKADGAIHKALTAGHGSFGAWEEHFRAVGQSLGGGSGWVIVDYGLLTGNVRTYWAGGHSQTLAAGLPLLVMDMYEHAYAIDYGAAAAKYIDAFFQNIKWEVVNHRLELAEKARALLAV